MLFTAMLSVLSANVMFLLLHISQNSSFPKPLSPKEEEELLTLSKNGDKEAKDKLIEHNLRLVAHIAKKYAQKMILMVSLQQWD